MVVNMYLVFGGLVLCRPSLIRLGAPVGEHEKNMYLLVYVNMYFLMFVNMYLVFGG